LSANSLATSSSSQPRITVSMAWATPGDIAGIVPAASVGEG